MSQFNTGAPAPNAKPEPDIYTILVIVANVFLLMAIVFVLHNLMSADGYAMSFDQLFKPLSALPK